PEGRPGAAAHRQDLQGREELLPRRRADRLLTLARDQAQLGGAAAGIRARLVQRAVAGAVAAGRAHRRELHERRPGRGIARRQGPPAAPMKRPLAALLLAFAASPSWAQA